MRKKEREAAARLRSRVAMGMENTAIDLPEEEGVFSLKTIKVSTVSELFFQRRALKPMAVTIAPLNSARQKLDGISLTPTGAMIIPRKCGRGQKCFSEQISYRFLRDVPCVCS